MQGEPVPDARAASRQARPRPRPTPPPAGERRRLGRLFDADRAVVERDSSEPDYFPGVPQPAKAEPDAPKPRPRPGRGTRPRPGAAG